MRRTAARRRRAVACSAALTLALVLASCTGSEGAGEGRDARSLQEMAAALGADVVRHLQRGIAPGVSGEVTIVPQPHFYMGISDRLPAIDTAAPEVFTAHAGPWNYLTRVPIVLHGPGYVEPGVYDDPEVDLADIAPTYARWMGMDELEGEGEPLAKGVAYGDDPPRLIFTVVVDGMGWNVLRQHPASWPNLRSLMEDGTLYSHATIGSSPSVTAAIHANLGTGTYPREHRVVANPDFTARDPSSLAVPTIGDLWDAQNDNEPVVGTISVRTTHLTMVGHGAQFEGGDRDVAVYWDPQRNRWTTATRHFALPGYVANQDIADLESYERRMDGDDGIADGRWFEDDIEELRSDGLHRIATSAFTRFQGDAVIRAVEEEDLGQDDLTDLFYVEFKGPDEAGHVWNMLGPQEAAVVGEVDRQLRRIKRALDERVGAGDYVLMISADHGQQPMAQAVGGWMIDQRELERDIETELDADVKVQSYQVDLPDELDPADVAAFLASYTIADNIPEGAEGAERVSESRRDRLVFAGAFPTTYLGDLSEDDIEALGASEWPEGNYGTVPGPR